MLTAKRRPVTGGASEFDLTAKWVNRVNDKNIAGRQEQGDTTFKPIGEIVARLVDRLAPDKTGRRP